LFAVRPRNDFIPGLGFIGIERAWQKVLVVGLGAALGVAGLLLYRLERGQE